MKIKIKDTIIYSRERDEKAIQQIKTFIEAGIVESGDIRIMPDYHYGASACIGFTAKYKDKICPNTIGVDIGCGVIGYKINKKLTRDDFVKLDNIIKKYIPFGFEVNKTNDKFAIDIINNLYCKDKLKDIDRLEKSLGSLGGGNHFIEVDKDENDNFWLIIHSGSRNLGKQVADIYQKIAVEKLKDKLPKELCYLTGTDMENYLHDMKLCQEFAIKNREKMAETILKNMNWNVCETVLSVHNYIDELGMIRKGAISAHKDENLIIPLNMGEGCIIGKGLGNKDWNYSAPHGAGRKLSRRQARETLSLENFKKEMENKGIYSTTVCEGTLDEAPGAYKNSDLIFEQINDTLIITNKLKPVYNFKANENSLRNK